MRRWLVLFALLPQCTGCLCYAYPTLSHTPTLAVPNPDGGAHAFRVDVERTERAPAAPSSQYTLSRIRIDERGLIPSQLELAHATGNYDPFSLMGGGTHERTKYTMQVRVYRPGYRTMEVKDWEKNAELHWVQAKDLVDQERAVDDLLSDRVSRDEIRLINGQFHPGPVAGPAPKSMDSTWWEQKDHKSPPLGLQSGKDAPLAHRQALLFAAGEYERLASSPAASQPSAQTARDRLRAKAAWLRQYAHLDPNAQHAAPPRPTHILPPPPTW
jgi:hypothetical protein